MNVLRDQPVKLIFLPYAGASFYAYRGFDKHLPDSVKVIAVDLPGHGKRMREPLLTDIRKMVEDLFHQVKDHLKGPYAIYGHSLGASLGYLLTRFIAERGEFPPPLHLFFSGKTGPMAGVEQGLHSLPRENFLHALRGYGGIPEEVLAHEELLELFIPILRADFQALDQYVHESGGPLDIPMTVMLGTEDRLTRDKEIEWEGMTKQALDVIRFRGNHFFIFEHLPEICGIISESLNGKSDESGMHANLTGP